MVQKRSYKIKQFSTNVQGEVDRLKAQVDLFWEKELRCYKQYGLSDGMKVLECGSGPGYVTEKILKEFPHCQATAIEIDSYLIDILKTVAVQNKFVISQQSITALAFKENSFDFVITRLVLEHFPDPEAALWEIHRVLKPGGKAVFIDNDFEMHLTTYPEIDEINALYKAYCQSRINEGGNPKIGRQLPSLMLQCGFKDVGLEVICAHNSLTGDDIFLKSEGVGIPAQLVKDGYLDASILDALAVKWHRVLKMDHHSIYRQLFVAAGEKIEGAVDHRSIKRVLEELDEHDLIGSSSSDFSFSSGPDKPKMPTKKSQSTKSQTDIMTYFLKLISSVRDMDGDAFGQRTFINDTGLDSLTVVEMINTIESDLGILLSLMDFFEGQRISDVVEKIYDLLCEKSVIRDDHGKNASSAGGEPLAHNSEIDIIEWEEGEI